MTTSTMLLQKRCRTCTSTYSSSVRRHSLSSSMFLVAFIYVIVVVTTSPYRCSSFQQTVTVVLSSRISSSSSSSSDFSVSNSIYDTITNYNSLQKQSSPSSSSSSSSSSLLILQASITTTTQGEEVATDTEEEEEEEDLLAGLDEDDLFAAYEAGTIDINELKDILGEDFDFEDDSEDGAGDDAGEYDDEDNINDDVNNNIVDDDNNDEVVDNLDDVDERLVAAVEEGTLDIEELEDILGEEIDFDDEINDEVDNTIDDEIDDEEEEENDMELLVQFMEYCRETPVGELELGDATLIRDVMENFPVASAPDHEVEEEEENTAITPLKASYVIESLLYRLVDEWRSSAVLLHKSSSKIDDDDDDDDSLIPLEERQEREQMFRPVADDFYRAIDAIWKDDEKKNDADSKAERIWNIFSEQQDVIEFLEDDDESSTATTSTTVKTYPNIESIEIILESMSICRGESGIERKASLIVGKLLPKYGLTPNPSVYGPYIQIVAKARNKGAARKAESILRKAIDEYPPPLSSSGQTTIGVDVFNTVVTAYAKARGEIDGPQRAQDLIVFMDGLESSSCAPNAKTFTSLVDAYAQTNDWDGVGQAQSILNNLLEQYLQEGHLEPSVATWTIVIAAWTRLSKKGRNGASKRAGDLLRRMESLSSLGKISVKPDAITYVTCFNAYAYSKSEEDVAEAERLLEEMNEMYLDGDDTMKPSVRSIKVLLNAWIKLGAIDKAENVLNQYEDMLIDDTNNDGMTVEDWKEIYRSILMGYTLQNNPKRATSYLKLMIDNQDIEPDTLCYNRIIESYIRLGQGDCARESQEIFELLESRRKAGAVSPDERVFTSFIKALTKGKVSGLYKKSELILKRMHSLSEGEGSSKLCRPTIFTYNAVLNACAESANIDDTPLQEAFQTSLRVFTKLREDIAWDPDHITYGNLIRCADLLPSSSQQESKDKFITHTFKLCCESGHVNNYFVRDFCGVASKDLWTSLTGFSYDDDVELDLEDATTLLEQLPTSWQRQRIDREKPPPTRTAVRPTSGGRGGRTSSGGRGGRSSGRSSGGRSSGGRSSGGRSSSGRSSSGRSSNSRTSNSRASNSSTSNSRTR
jgi:hypothetical protein